MRNKVRLESIRFDAEEGTTLKIEVRCWPTKKDDQPFDPRPLLRVIKQHMDQEDETDGNQG